VWVSQIRRVGRPEGNRVNCAGTATAGEWAESGNSVYIFNIEKDPAGFSPQGLFRYLW